jgi:2-polyprenyl-3-methyl-5-hydroxy-6-metoxy-1,4-benzoquinol methylase
MTQPDAAEPSTVRDRPATSQIVVLAACPLCGSQQAQPLATYPELVWVRCDCGLIYKRSEAPDPTAAEFYEDGYFGAGEQGRRYTQRTRRRIQKSRNQILDALNHARPGPLLDIGCSVGYTLTAARQLGMLPTGADLSSYAVQTCRAQGFRAETGKLDALPFADGEFAVVTMKHVLEHTPDPRGALREVRRVLRTDGAVFIAIPHAGYGKSVRSPQTSRFYLPAAHGREHFVYYTPATLSRLLEQEGFRVVRVHPELVHRAASLPRRIGETLLAPWRAVGQALLSAAQARKEFWLIAVRA